MAWRRTLSPFFRSFQPATRASRRSETGSKTRRLKWPKAWARGQTFGPRWEFTMQVGLCSPQHYVTPRVASPLRAKNHGWLPSRNTSASGTTGTSIPPSLSSLPRHWIILIFSYYRHFSRIPQLPTILPSTMNTILISWLKQEFCNSFCEDLTLSWYSESRFLRAWVTDEKGKFEDYVTECRILCSIFN